MRIATWNVNGIRARTAQFAEWLARERPEVVCLQEIKAERAQIPAEVQLPDYHAYWHGQRGYSGVSLHVLKSVFPAEPAFTHPDFDMESRVVQADLGALLVASVYVPNGGRDYAAKIAFMQRLVAWARGVRASGRELVVCGDLNVARTDMDVHAKELKAEVVGQRAEERALIEALLAEGGLVDVGRALDPDNPNLFTWWAPWRNLRARNIGWRIDYILASQALATKAERCVVQADVGTSDHAPVVMTLGG